SGAALERCARARARRWVELDLARPRVRNGVVTGRIVMRDRFGNLISNLEPAHLRGSKAEDLRGWRLEIGGRALPIRATYAEAASGELLALVDSYGALEIAVRDGSAAERLELGPGAATTARRTG